MSSVLTGLIAVFFGTVIVNGFAAGIVAYLYLGKRKGTVTARALHGAGITASIVLLMFSGALIDDMLTGDIETAVAFMAVAIIGCLAAVLSLPGAVIMARRLASVDSGVGSTFD